MTFNQKVWNTCKKIPSGKISTYKEIANQLNSKAYRAVGTALNKNPYGYNNKLIDKFELVPCHRVINSNGHIGGFAHGSNKKTVLLKKEGIKIKNNTIDLKKYLFEFKE